MNNIKKILAEQEEEINEGFIDTECGDADCHTLTEYLKEDFTVTDLKDFIRQSQKTLAQEIIKELVGEEKEAKVCKTYPDYLKGRIYGGNKKLREAKAKGEEILKELN